MSTFESEVSDTERWFASPRFQGITRLYSARQVVEQRGTILVDYPVALQRRVALVGGVATTASDQAAAKSWLSFITSSEAATAYGANCLRPPAPAESGRP